jgi:glycerol-3-phosphate dehydrogenase
MNSEAGREAPPPSAETIHRADLLEQLETRSNWDLIVVGGGATGLGIALDGATRGLSVALIEAEDFAKGTSSRATKLVHGGVRYLAQGNIGLVREALRERASLLQAAPHLVQPLAFVMPVYGGKGAWFDKWFYGIGLLLYDLLAGSRSLGKTRLLSRTQTAELLHGVREQGLAGGVQYWDGQFDDARYALALARTAIAYGACVINHCKAVELHKEDGRMAGVVAEDRETRRRYRLLSKCVVNATGVWVDTVRRMGDRRRDNLIAPSQGIHLVVDRDFLPGDRALIVPKTEDGRVLFAIPWLGKTLLGTTDTARQEVEYEPAPLREEVEFILREASRYLERAPTRADVRSVWVGLRPLVRPPKSGTVQTKKISREHTVLVENDGLLTVTGGKWTTYRAMAEDVFDRGVAAGLIPDVGPSRTAALQLVGAADRQSRGLNESPGLHLYGTDAQIVQALPGADREFAPGLTEAMVRFAARYELARSVEDVLARRSRLLFLDAATGSSIASLVADILAEELDGHFDAAGSIAAFEELARRYATLP